MKPSQASDLKAFKNILATAILLYALFLETQCLFFWGKYAGSKQAVRSGTYVSWAKVCNRKRPPLQEKAEAV